MTEGGLFPTYTILHFLDNFFYKIKQYKINKNNYEYNIKGSISLEDKF